MLGVIICPKCSRVQGADLKSAHVSCSRCGARVDVRKAKVYFSTESSKELAEAVRQISLQINDDGKSDGSSRRVRVRKLKEKPEDEIEIRAALEKSLKGKETLSRSDLRKALQLKDGAELDAAVSKLLEAGVIFEIQPEEYKLV